MYPKEAKVTASFNYLNGSWARSSHTLSPAPLTSRAYPSLLPPHSPASSLFSIIPPFSLTPRDPKPRALGSCTLTPLQWLRYLITCFILLFLFFCVFDLCLFFVIWTTTRNQQTEVITRAPTLARNKNQKNKSAGRSQSPLSKTNDHAKHRHVDPLVMVYCIPSRASNSSHNSNVCKNILYIQYIKSWVKI